MNTNTGEANKKNDTEGGENGVNDKVVANPAALIAILVMLFN